MKQDSITNTQYEDLLQIGYDGTEDCSVDEAIEWLRRKYNVVIYNKAAPFVDPKSRGDILYAYAVKFCNVKRGYNFRENVGEGMWNKNIFTAKKEAITIAVKYIKAQKERKAKVIQL